MSYRDADDAIITLYEALQRASIWLANDPDTESNDEQWEVFAHCVTALFLSRDAYNGVGKEKKEDEPR